MNLFHESENKYFEFLSYLVNEQKAFTDKEIIVCLDQRLGDSHDYDIEDSLFDHDPDNATVFTYENGKYRSVLAERLPVRTNCIENQAFRSLVDSPFARQFLSEKLIEKIRSSAAHIDLEWTPQDIRIKSQSVAGISSDEAVYQETLKTIITAISSHHAIRYDNVLPGKYEFRNSVMFPVRIEYSFINDILRICAYSEEEDRFIKLNLTSMSNVSMMEDTQDNLEDEYKEFLELNMKKVVLDVEPVGHVIERCFRIFSFYDRLARYDRDNEKYTLEISYLKSDETEVIRDILSLGGYVVVVEPRRIQKEIYKRIIQARERYR